MSDMKSALVRMAAAAVLLAGCGYSEEFRADFLVACLDTSGGEVDYCECVLDHLERYGPADEEAITVQDQQAAIKACEGLVNGEQEGAAQTSNT